MDERAGSGAVPRTPIGTVPHVPRSRFERRRFVPMNAHQVSDVIHKARLLHPWRLWPRGRLRSGKLKACQHKFGATRHTYGIGGALRPTLVILKKSVSFLTLGISKDTEEDGRSYVRRVTIKSVSSEDKYSYTQSRCEFKESFTFLTSASQ